MLATSFASSEYLLSDRYEALIRVSQAIGAHRDPQDLFRAMATELRRVIQFDGIVVAQYDEASGDKVPTDGTHGTFDTMYPTAHDRFGIADQFGWQNIVALRFGVTIEPHRRWTVTTQYLDFWLASATDSLYNTSGGSIVRDSTGKSGTHIGREADVYTWWELNRHINVGVGVGHFMGGEFLEKTTKGPNYNYPYTAVRLKVE